MFEQDDYDEPRDYLFEINEAIQSMLPADDNILYNGLEYLETDISLINQDNANNIHICAYHINRNLHTPFIQYFLHKPFNNNADVNNSLFIFPNFKYKNIQDLFVKCTNTIEILCSSFYKESKFEYKGFLIIDKNVYIFYDCSHMIIDTLKMTKTNDLWLVTIDEIINHNKVCNFTIHSSIVDMFHNYEKLLYLSNPITGEIYQSPIIAYSFCKTEQLDFIATFGISTKPTGIFGNHYYFTDINTLFKIHENMNFGLLRCILFLGNTKIVLNAKNDPIDPSEISQQLLIDHPSNRLKLRITDYDSSWTLLYDSIYVGKVELDDGTILPEGPLWCVKKRDYYHILSYHKITTQNNASII